MHKYPKLKKILIIRFSSIGDIVLTTPVVRCIRKQIPGVEIHYLIKKQFAPVLETNPYIDQLHFLDNSLSKLAGNLKKQDFDFIIDLHNNLRSARLKRLLGRPSKSFPKLNIEKWLMVNLKINRLPDIHIVDRYFDAVSGLNIQNDDLGLDYFIPANDEFDPAWLPESHRGRFIGFVLGGRHKTKIFPVEKVIEVCRLLNDPVVLIGGPEDAENGKLIADVLPGSVFNSCGQFSLSRSAALVKHAELIITNDTGLMHVAAAFNKRIISLWGNTVPEFGMYPYLPPENKTNSVMFEVKDLKCRPCSKIGFEKCPQKHFDCMKLIKSHKIAETANALMQ